MRKRFLILCLALLFSGTLSGLALASSGNGEPGKAKVEVNTPPDKSQSPWLSYARVLTGNVPVYADPTHATSGYNPMRWIAPGYTWVSLTSSQVVDQQGQAWYVINEDEYLKADYVQNYSPSTFRGTASPGTGPFAWIVFETQTSPQPGVAPSTGSQQLKRYDKINIGKAEQVNGRFWYQIAEGHWVEQGNVGIVEAKPRPEGVGPEEKWIEVDLYEQTLAAYEGDELVYGTLVSSGLPAWETVTGLFQVWVKVEKGKMSGSYGLPDYYFLEDVPWTMYFYGDYAIHGAYWHDRFGMKHSHGCVNVALTDAQWLFEWATPISAQNYTPSTSENPGVWVWVHR